MVGLQKNQPAIASALTREDAALKQQISNAIQNRKMVLQRQKYVNRGVLPDPSAEDWLDDGGFGNREGYYNGGESREDESFRAASTLANPQFSQEALGEFDASPRVFSETRDFHYGGVLQRSNYPGQLPSDQLAPREQQGDSIFRGAAERWQRAQENQKRSSPSERRPRRELPMAAMSELPMVLPVQQPASAAQAVQAPTPKSSLGDPTMSERVVMYECSSQECFDRRGKLEERRKDEKKVERSHEIPLSGHLDPEAVVGGSAYSHKQSRHQQQQQEQQVQQAVFDPEQPFFPLLPAIHSTGACTVQCPSQYSPPHTSSPLGQRHPLTAATRKPLQLMSEGNDHPPPTMSPSPTSCPNVKWAHEKENAFGLLTLDQGDKQFVIRLATTPLSRKREANVNLIVLGLVFAVLFVNFGLNRVQKY